MCMCVTGETNARVMNICVFSVTEVCTTTVVFVHMLSIFVIFCNLFGGELRPIRHCQIVGLHIKI